MQDNYTYDEMELLIRYMDGEADAEEKAATEKMLHENINLQQRYENLIMARQAIRSRGLREKVQALHQQFYEQHQQETARVVKPSFAKTLLRIAAVFVLVVVGYFIYEYTTTSNEILYADNFVSYDLPVARGNEQADDIDALYNAKNYAAVINAINTKPVKTQKDFFLKGQSYLQTNNAMAAIAAFKVVEEKNMQSNEKYFEQETDYYLALAYIKANDIDNAKRQLERIAANKQHMYYNKAKEISSTKLMILDWKK